MPYYWLQISEAADNHLHVRAEVCDGPAAHGSITAVFGHQHAPHLPPAPPPIRHRGHPLPSDWDTASIAAQSSAQGLAQGLARGFDGVSMSALSAQQQSGPRVQGLGSDLDRMGAVHQLRLPAHACSGNVTWPVLNEVIVRGLAHEVDGRLVTLHVLPGGAQGSTADRILLAAGQV